MHCIRSSYPVPLKLVIASSVILNNLVTPWFNVTRVTESGSGPCKKNFTVNMKMRGMVMRKNCIENCRFQSREEIRTRFRVLLINLVIRDCFL